MDGNQKQLFRDDKKGANLPFEVPFYNNLGDNYTVLAYADNYEQAGFHPVKVSNVRDASIDIMLLPKNGTFRFRNQDWATLKQADPDLANLLGHGAAIEDEAAGRYNELVDRRPPTLAALLNITTA